LALSFPRNIAASVTPTRCRRSTRIEAPDPREPADAHFGIGPSRPPSPGPAAPRTRRARRPRRTPSTRRALRDPVARPTRDAHPQQPTFSVHVAAKATIVTCRVPTLTTSFATNALIAGQGREPPRPTSAAPAAHEAGSRTRRSAGPSTTTDVDVTAGRPQRRVVACQTGRHESRRDVSNPRSSGRRLDVQRARPTCRLQSDGTVAITCDLDSGAWLGEIQLRISTLHPVADRLLPGDVPVQSRSLAEEVSARLRSETANEKRQRRRNAIPTMLEMEGRVSLGLARVGLPGMASRNNSGPSTFEVMDRLHPLFDQLRSGGFRAVGRDGFDGRGRRGYCRTRRL